MDIMTYHLSYNSYVLCSTRALMKVMKVIIKSNLKS